MVFSLPSAAATPAILVPRIPITPTGVFSIIPSGSVFAISPDMKENTPCTMFAENLPSCCSGL